MITWTTRLAAAMIAATKAEHAAKLDAAQAKQVRRPSRLLPRPPPKSPTHAVRQHE